MLNEDDVNDFDDVLESAGGLFEAYRNGYVLINSETSTIFIHEYEITDPKLYSMIVNFCSAARDAVECLNQIDNYLDSI